MSVDKQNGRSDLGNMVEDLRSKLTGPGAPFELEQVQLPDGREVKAYRHAFRDFPELLNAARVHGQAEFLVYGEDRWTYDRFFAAADAMASRLQNELDVKKGDRIGVAMRNRPEWAVAVVGAALIGAIPVPLNSFGLSSELSASLEDTTPAWLVCDKDRYDRVREGFADKPAGNSPKLIVVDAEVGDYGWNTLIAAGHSGYETPEIDPDEQALILFTSGSSSRAKGVSSSHRSVCQSIHNIDYIGAIAAMTSPDAVARIMAKKLQPTTLCAVPLFHISGLHAQLLISMRHGRRLVFMYRWDAAQALEIIRNERVTQFNGAPSMVQQLIERPEFNQDEYSANLSGLGFGGAAINPRLIEDVFQKIPGRMSGIGFGLTESNGVCAACSGSLFEKHPEIAGTLSPVIDIKVVDLDGSDVQPGLPGEVWLSGVTLMQGYWAQPEATQAVMEGHWFRTGDVGVISADGFLTIVDRIKDVINRSGEKIAAVEVESCLMQHEQLDEVAVFSMPDEVTGEQVVAVVVGKPQSSLSEATLRDFVAQRLASYKVPSKVFLRSQPLPRNPAGKMLKSTLRKEFENLI